MKVDYTTILPTAPTYVWQHQFVGEDTSDGETTPPGRPRQKGQPAGLGHFTAVALPIFKQRKMGPVKPQGLTWMNPSSLDKKPLPASVQHGFPRWPKKGSKERGSKVAATLDPKPVVEKPRAASKTLMADTVATSLLMLSEAAFIKA